MAYKEFVMKIWVLSTIQEVCGMLFFRFQWDLYIVSLHWEERRKVLAMSCLPAWLKWPPQVLTWHQINVFYSDSMLSKTATSLECQRTFSVYVTLYKLTRNIWRLSPLALAQARYICWKTALFLHWCPSLYVDNTRVEWLMHLTK